MALDIGNFLTSVVEGGKNLVESVGAGLADAGNFVAKVVKDDAKDLISTVRNNPFTSPGARAMIDKFYGDALTSTGHKEFAEATDPKKKSAAENLANFGNTALNIASFIPGFGAGVKAAQTGIKSSKYVKGGTKLLREGAGKKLSGFIDEKRANELVQKGFENAMPRAARRKAQDAVADSTLEALNQVPAKEIASWLREKSANLNVLFSKGDPLGRTVKNYKAAGPLGQKIRQKAFFASQEGDLLNHLGKVTVAKGIRIGSDALKHGAKAGAKQFAAHGANTARKRGNSEIFGEDSSAKPAPLGNKGPVTRDNKPPRNIIGPSGVTDPKVLKALNDAEMAAKEIRKKRKKQY